MTVEFEMPAADRVHLFAFRLAADPSDRALLAPEEVARADRYRFARDRDRFIAARAQLRRVLGAHVAERPGAVRFRYGPFGKPEIKHPLRFNLSHSGDFCALALARFELGVDIEEIRPVEEKIAEDCFASDEVARLRRLPASLQTAAFFACWTRKEAYVKASGAGLQERLDGFSVSLEPLEQARVLRVKGDLLEPGRWRMRHIEPFAGVCGAVAARWEFTHLFDLSGALPRLRQPE